MAFTPIVPQRAPRRRVSGCLAGCFTQVLGALLLGLVVLLVVYVIVAPWGFYLGGTFHAWPYWQGVGTMYGPGGDYAVYIIMYPSTRGSGSAYHLGGPGVNGSANVCSPHGEKYNLRLTGGFSNRLGFRQTDTNGQPVGITLHERLNFLSTNANTRLSLYFHGTWQNPNLVVDDKGTLSRAFNSDGSWTPTDRSKRVPGEPVSLTLHPGSKSDFDAACAALKK